MKKQLEDQPIPEVWDSNDVINLCDRVQEIFKQEPNILQRINNINNQNFIFKKKILFLNSLSPNQSIWRYPWTIQRIDKNSQFHWKSLQ